MNADVIYPPELITRIIEEENETVLAVDIKKCGREEVKVIEGNNNRITAIGKELIEEKLSRGVSWSCKIIKRI